jgi:hypothetical protein
MIILGRESAVPARLRARYYLWNNRGQGNDFITLDPLVHIGKDAVPEIIDMLSAGVLREDWAVGVLQIITFQYSIRPTEEEEETGDLRRVATEFAKWWDLHKDESRTKWAIDGLRSENEFTRSDSLDYLERLAGNKFSYDLSKSVPENQESIKKWEEWYEKNKKK